MSRLILLFSLLTLVTATTHHHHHHHQHHHHAKFTSPHHSPIHGSHELRQPLYNRRIPGIVDPIQAVHDLITRRLPKHTTQFTFQLMNTTIFSHIFEITGTDGNIIISGESGVSLAAGVNHYLKYVVNVQMLSWSGSQLSTLPATLPAVNGTIRVTSNLKYSYYQNVCTVSYSMVWWDWARWEQEIDWMALNGINMPLAFQGQEEIWYHVYTQLGLTEQELTSFFAGPAFLAWGRMGNVRGWGGPLPRTWMISQSTLQLQILARMRSYGMTPVLPAFAGFVPSALSRVFPNAKIHTSGSWNNFPPSYCCVSLLDPDDTLYQTIGAAFIQLQASIYGTDHLYNADTFNENRPSSNDPTYLKSISHAVYTSMQVADPDAVWIMQGWLFVNDPTFWQPTQIQALLSGAPDTNMIILDLFSDVVPVYLQTAGYYGKPWIWCMLHNFGGNIGFYGRVDVITSEPIKAFNAPNSTMIGIGMTPEGINQNYVLYELMAEMMWHQTPVDYIAWIQQYVTRRYGGYDLASQAAWKLLTNTVYICNSGQKSVIKSAIELNPHLDMNRTGFMPTTLYYDPSVLVTILSSMFFVSTSLQQQITYQYDLVDLTRQALSNLFLSTHAQLTTSYHQHDLPSATKYATTLIQLITDIDTLLGTNQYFLLGSFLADAKREGNAAGQEDVFEFNARNQITMWGPDGEIQDYASKAWNGLYSGYYLPRWTLYTNYLLDCIRTNHTYDQSLLDLSLQPIQLAWQTEKQIYPNQAQGDAVKMARTLFDTYFPQ